MGSKITGSSLGVMSLGFIGDSGFGEFYITRFLQRRLVMTRSRYREEFCRRRSDAFEALVKILWLQGSGLLGKGVGLGIEKFGSAGLRS